MRILAIDPGTEESAYVVTDDHGRVLLHGITRNPDLLSRLAFELLLVEHVAIEMVASYGAPVGAETFETVRWIGRFEEARRRDHYPGDSAEVLLIKRPEIKQHLCHKIAGINDAAIRQRILDLYGGKEKAIGSKAKPGPLYGIKADEWQALALAIVARERIEKTAKPALAAARELEPGL